MTKQQKQVPVTLEDWEDAVRNQNRAQFGSGYSSGGQLNENDPSPKQVNEARRTSGHNAGTRQMVYSCECTQQMC